ncbi:YdcF family protein [Luteimonas salinilitoris]|uniref:YdcF family protein n=1 Tax=Luteimonas salinilitoris TaxID=3237697 RepID=A0ABV4HPM0_9GAMM
MLSLLQDLLLALIYPPMLSLCLLVCGGLVLLLRWRRSAAAIMVFAVAWSLVWSIPQASDWLRGRLESRHPTVAEAALPEADAIVVLGGGYYGWLKRRNVDPEQLKGSRLAAGARAWQARRAPVVVLSGDGSEAPKMAAGIARLGVPASAVVLDDRSRSTRDNARFTAVLAERRGMERILLVTSALHMPRALRAFRNAGLDAVPVPVPETSPRVGWRERWLPSRRALWRSSRALKEYVALAALHLTDERRPRTRSSHRVDTAESGANAGPEKRRTSQESVSLRSATVCIGRGTARFFPRQRPTAAGS